MTTLEAISKLMKLDDTAIPMWAMVVVGHIKEDGGEAFAYYITEPAPASQVTYALESIKHDALHSGDTRE
jgi:hypothetical protein